MKVRAKDRYILTHPLFGTQIVVQAGQPFDSDDALVQSQRWAFEDAEPAVEKRRRVERATRAPGELRDL